MPAALEYGRERRVTRVALSFLSQVGLVLCISTFWSAESYVLSTYPFHLFHFLLFYFSTFNQHIYMTSKFSSHHREQVEAQTDDTITELQIPKILCIIF